MFNKYFEVLVASVETIVSFIHLYILIRLFIYFFKLIFLCCY
jgi:hypothetical protein